MVPEFPVVPDLLRWRGPGELPAPGMPHPGQLAALGVVLCLYRPELGPELEGWRRARKLSACQHVDSDGLHERLAFADAQGQCCWQLCLLPDSDFLAWDRLLAGVPAAPQACAAGIAERLWRRLACRLRGESWQGKVVRLRAAGPLGMTLAAQVATPSPLGLQVARRWHRGEGIAAFAEDGVLAG
ncbi:MAG TPA: Hemin transport protein [Stenotrophomonas sp.]|nr:Hemin transport protein [Stenotrophomonas sp.]